MTKTTPNISDDTTCCTDSTADPQKPCIIIVHASVGSGHKSAANAIAEAFSASPDFTDYSIEVYDILDFGKIVFDGNKYASSFTGATRPIYDITWRYFLTGRVLWGGGTAFSYFMYNRFTAFMAKKNVRAVVATHIVAANAAAAARMLTKANYPIICVPTDYETEGLWPHKHTDLFCVADESMAETLRARNVSDEHIAITGIPTRIDFCKSYDQTQAKECFGLPRDKKVILMLAGASLPQPYKRFRSTLESMLPHFKSLEDYFHFAIVCGKDKEYETELTEQIDRYLLTNVSTFGYVNQMSQLMQASDLVICKPGGLTVTECLCANVPMLLLGRSYGQEKINVRMLTSAGAAMHVTTAREAIERLRYFSVNENSMKTMLVNTVNIRKPRAAFDIVCYTQALIELSDSNPNAFTRKKHFIDIYVGNPPAHTR